FYASIADAGPDVQTCLDKNTFGTLQLALRCGEAPYQLSSDTRECLEAFRPAIETDTLQEKTSGELRSLARLLLARFLGQSSPVDSTSAPRLGLVPAGIYRVFLADKKPFPDAPAIEEQEPDASAVGMRASDAMAFVAWINEGSIGSPAHRLNTTYLSVR
ncbi:MAG: hypothetical protein J2P34_06000, partial [Actinobacteria bacterium]|nr:hypothetical protein [Actinomycetota bacterium]